MIKTRIMKESNNHYNKSLKHLASQKRKNGTTAEIVIWNNLLKGKKLGVKFLRQRPINNFIVDFFCKDLNLIIEIDGYSHTLEEIKENDIKREITLKSFGYEIIRFSDIQILKDINNVELAICQKINELSKKED